MTTTHTGTRAPSLDRANDSSAKSLKALAIRGSLWTVIGFVGTQTLRMGNTVVLAWVLGPAVLGLMSIVRVLTTGLEMCSDLGIGPSIIQNRRGDDPAFLNTAWTIQVIRGAILWGACLLVAIPLGFVYDEPQLFLLIPVVGFSMVISGFNSTSMFTLNRRMAIGKLKVIDMAVQFVTVGTMIGAAYLTHSIWGIVAGWLLGSIVRLLISHSVNDVTRHRFQWDDEAKRDLYTFGKWIFLSTVITFLAGQLDRPILGKLVTWSELGIYHVAMVVAIMPQQVASQLCMLVLYPVLANRARERPEDLAADLLRARRTILPFGLLATLGVAVISPIFFRLLFDVRYQGAATIAQLSTIPMWFTILHATADRGPLALGDSRSLMFSNTIRFIGSTAGCIFGFYLYGLAGFVLGLSAGTLLGHVVIQMALAKHGVRIYRQDAAWTATFAMLGVLGVVLPAWIIQQIDVSMDPLLLRLAAGLVVMVVMSLWSAGRVRSELSNR